MGLVRSLLWGLAVFALLALALAAPSDTKAEEKVSEVAEKEPTKKVEERAVLVSDATWDTWVSNNAWSIATGTLGTIFLIGGLGLAFYYFYFLNYYGYSADPYTGYQYNNQYPAASQQYQGQYYTPSVARSLDTGAASNWNISWGQVLYMIHLAQESYEKFDFQSLDCQKKALCELSQKQGDFGETGRKISNTFSVMDAIEGLPMPTVIQNYLKEYREAITQGKSSTKECSAVYPKCGFSIKEVFVKYQKRAASGKF